MPKENIILNSVLNNTQVFYVSEEPDPVKRCTGTNNKKLLIVSENSLEEEHLELLGKILRAVQHDLKSDTLLLKQAENQPLNLNDIYNDQTVEKVLVFGLSATLLGLNVDYTPYQSFDLAGRTYLFADQLSKIALQKELKAALWNALQKIWPKEK